MKYEIRWPTEKPKVVKNFLQTHIDLFEEKIGALSQDPENPLSRVCVANSCISLEPVRGCPLECIYCVAGNDCRNLTITKDDYHKPFESLKIETIFPRKPQVLFPGDILTEAMMQHPGFIRDKTVVSMVVGSSEAFLPVVEKETWSILKTMMEHGLRNPVWIVTKFGIPTRFLDEWRERLTRVIQSGIRVVISITDTNAPSWLEPYRGDRFKNYRTIQDTGVYFSHHLRPVIEGVNDSDETLRVSLRKSLDFVKSVCVGGLRIDPAIQLRWKYAETALTINNNYRNLMTGNPVGKQMPDDLYNRVKNIVANLGYSTPVFLRSSKMLSRALAINDFNLYDFRNDEGTEFLNIPLRIQERIKKKHKKPLIEVLRDIAGTIKLHRAVFTQSGERIFLQNNYNYQEIRLLTHAIGHSGVLFE